MELIKINDNNRVDLRTLHDKLEIGGRFRDYVRNTLVKYGFEEGYDYFKRATIVGETNQTAFDYDVTIDCAKELCMLAKSDKGRMFRKYFIATEKALQVVRPDVIERLQRIEERKNSHLTYSIGAKKFAPLDEQIESLLDQLQATEKALQDKVKYIEDITTVASRTVCLSDICAKFVDCYPVIILCKLYEYGMLEKRASGQYPSADYSEGNSFIPTIDRYGRAYVRYTPKGEMIVTEFLLGLGYKLK